MRETVQVAVVGSGESERQRDALAEALGAALARAGAAVCCGGLGGVMAAACRGARLEGGLTLGLLPGDSHEAANEHVSLAVPTGMGEMRNALVVRSAQVVVALDGGPGTLSEVALALKAGKPVVGLCAWSQLDGVHACEDAGEAARLALELAAR
jgi:uncharacterized protein (TIGR00725 family)